MAGDDTRGAARVRRLGLAVVHGRSMLPTLREGDRLLVLHGGAPRRGGLAVCRLPGGVVAVNGTVTAALAEEMGQLFLEVIIARDVDANARGALEKKKNVRVVTIPAAHWSAGKPGLMGVWVQDAALVQDDDAGFPEWERAETVTRRKANEREHKAMRMAWIVAKHVKSNAIVVADGEGTVGIGAGQMSRVDSSHLAAHKAGKAGLEVRGAVAASDAFFPFADGVQELAKVGIAAVVQPGGSIRDQEVIAAADAAGMTMLFTGRRHFRHV